MDSLSLQPSGVLLYGASHFNGEQLASLDLIQQQVSRDFADSNLSFDICRTSKLLVDFRAEGHCDKIITKFVDYLRSLQFRDILVVFNAVVDTNALDYDAVSMPTYLTNHENWFDLVDSVQHPDTIDTKFICLMRRPSPSRARIAQAMLEISSMKLSFGSNYFPEEIGEYKDYFPGRQIPLLIDGFTKRDNGLPEHDQRDAVFHSSTFNIVVESGAQTDPTVWKSLFITEKTFKAFGLRQIPIWFAMPGLVAEVRKLGFDLFDDVIDHGYDLIRDEHERFDAVKRIILDLDKKYDLAACQSLRRTMHGRLLANYEKTKSLAQEAHSSWYSLVRRYAQSNQ